MQFDDQVKEYIMRVLSFDKIKEAGIMNVTAQ